MTTSNSSVDRSGNPTSRSHVIVSGYYGFENLGDEAILEELTNELKRLRRPEEIVVLSADPPATAAKFGVRAISRSSPSVLLESLKQADTFISGGGGLFQDTKSIGSILFYGLQILAAKAAGARVMVYAQGLGPLKGLISQGLTREFFKRADTITVRDDSSASLMNEWKLSFERTADPVWCLDGRPLPDALLWKDIDPNSAVGLSLRNHPLLLDEHIHMLAKGLASSLPATSVVYLLPMQAAQDEEPLNKFAAHWQSLGRTSTLLDVSALTLPSQWVALMSKFHMVVGMRLHALLLALKNGTPVIGLAYDPKVSHLLTEFEQPILNLTKEIDEQLWANTIKNGLARRSHLSATAISKSEAAKNLACQNFSALARILNTQNES